MPRVYGSTRHPGSWLRPLHGGTDDSGSWQVTGGSSGKTGSLRVPQDGDLLWWLVLKRFVLWVPFLEPSHTAAHDSVVGAFMSDLSAREAQGFVWVSLLGRAQEQDGCDGENWSSLYQKRLLFRLSMKAFSQNSF